jgi:hypothetical protein
MNKQPTSFDRIRRVAEHLALAGWLTLLAWLVMLWLTED